MLFSQAFRESDIIINANYGIPQVSAFLLKNAVKLYYKNNKKDNENFLINVSNSGVINGKTEYGLTENVGLGLVGSYWNINCDIINNYEDNDPVTTSLNKYVDEYNVKVSSLAIGIRGAYHFVEDIKAKKIDPYIGLTLGVSRYTFDLGFTTSYPGKTLPVDVYKFKSGWAQYFSSTFGIRIYPIPYLGLNLEAGYDRGALLFGGVCLRIPSKKTAEYQKNLENESLEKKKSD